MGETNGQTETKRSVRIKKNKIGLKSYTYEQHFNYLPVNCDSMSGIHLGICTISTGIPTGLHYRG